MSLYTEQVRHYVREFNANILSVGAEARVNPVNCVGVSGKGLALAFKEHYPENYKQYHDVCKKGLLKIGTCFTTKDEDSDQYIINFPTKDDWRNPSTLEYINLGMIALVKHIVKYNIQIIAIPHLGCGLGGLKWDDVREIILKHLVPLIKNGLVVNLVGEENCLSVKK